MLSLHEKFYFNFKCFINTNSFLKEFGLDNSVVLDVDPFWFIGFILAFFVFWAALVSMAEPAKSLESKETQSSSEKTVTSNKDNNLGYIDIVWAWVNSGTTITNTSSSISNETTRVGFFFYNTRGIRGQVFNNLLTSPLAIPSIVQIGGVWYTGYYFGHTYGVHHIPSLSQADRRLGVKFRQFQELKRTNVITSLNTPIDIDERGDLPIRFSGNTVSTGSTR